jgi:hypothetical protein
MRRKERRETGEQIIDLQHALVGQGRAETIADAQTAFRQVSKISVDKFGY